MDSLAQFKPSFTPQDLLNGLKQNEFILHYQPIIDSKNLEIVGFEALIRWQHKRYGLLYPHSFIDVLESDECIHLIGQMVIEKAIKQVKIWQKLTRKPISISVNLTDRQFLERNFVQYITKILKKYNFNPSNLTLELTERTKSDVKHLKTVFDSLRKLGVKIAIDDFGKGFNCLYYLQSLPFDLLKIDRDFVLNKPNLKEQIVMNGIISIAQQINVAVLIEGIETEENHNKYRYIADFLQGYFYSKPLSIKEVEKILSLTGKVGE